jgi:hypothetical protein
MGRKFAGAGRKGEEANRWDEAGGVVGRKEWRWRQRRKIVCA